MNILLISFYFPNSSAAESIQTGRITKVLSNRGYKVDVITVDLVKYKKFHDNKLGSVFSFNNNVNIYKTTSINFLDNRYLSKIIDLPPFNKVFPDNKWWWLPLAIARSEEMINKKNYDLVYTRAQPFTSNLVGLYLKNKYDIPWIAHLSDPWADSPFRRYGDSTINLSRYLERKIFTNTDYITVPSVRMEEFYKNKYNMDKIYTVGHIFDNDLLKYRNAKPETKKSDKITVIHAGGFYSFRSPERFIAALHYIKSNINKELIDNLRVIFIGGVSKSIIDKINKMNLGDNFEFIDRVGYLESIEYMRQASILLLIDTHFNESVNNMFFPSKLVDYLGIGIPVIGMGDNLSVSKQILEELNYPFININSSVKEQAYYLYRAIIDLTKKQSYPNMRVFENNYIGHNPMETLDVLLKQFNNDNKERINYGFKCGK